MSVFVLAASGAAHAAVFTGTGSSAGYPVAAEADFDVNAGLITIMLTNDTTYTHDAGQLLTGLRFSLSNGETAVAAAHFTGTGILRTLASDGTYQDSDTATLSWELGLGPVMQLDFNPDAKEAIIGTPTADGSYVSNGSVAGNHAHNPFVAQKATFLLSGQDISPTTTVSGVTFLFNTGLSQQIAGNPVQGGTVMAVPEPASLGVLGVAGAALLARRKRR